MKFEVRYPAGTPHEVTLQGTVAILGRDPSCDLVLNDPRCSRRHAVIEAGPQGLSIRDTGSANGIVVNGSKVERAVLKPGDEVRLGEIVLKVLGEDMPGTVVMGPEDMVDFAGGQQASPGAPPRQAPGPPTTTALPVLPDAPPPRPAAPGRPPAPRAAAAPPPRAPSPPPPRPPAAAEPRAPVPQRSPAASRVPPPPAPEEELDVEDAQGPPPRPLAITVLALLWGLGILVYIADALWLAAVSQGATRIVGLVFGGLLSLLSVAMAFGLWTRAGWARILQIVLAGVGILTCAFAPVSIVILVYMLRADTRLQFSGADLGELAPADAERLGRDDSSLFTVAIVGALLLSLLLAGGAYFAIGTLGMGIENLSQTGSTAREGVAIVNLRTLASAQQAFRAGTCDGFADLGGLMNPSSLIPNYPPAGPAFLPEDFALAERGGYRYELRVEEPLEPPDGCPSRLYRRYAFSASPVAGAGRHFLIAPDGQVRFAQDRPATQQDPPLN